jgi:phospholipid/cholesterol/gamma-HCH transport system substrate-binding protein
MTKTTNNLKLGIFVTVGTAFLILALYLIGSKKQLFSDTVKINAVFHNVDGLRSGNNVRFAGITVGTIDKINITSDSNVVVTMLIDKESLKFIRKSSIADIGSDGLMGNKLVNILPGKDDLTVLIENDTIFSKSPIATDDIIRTFSNTNDNVLGISQDLKAITKRINENKVIWKLLEDTITSNQIKNSVRNMEAMTSNATAITTDVEDLLNDIKNGKGAIGKVMSDDKTAEELEDILKNLKDATDTAKLALHHMHEFMRDLNILPGPLGVLARDTAMASDMKSMVHNLNLSTATLDENMKALQSNFLFRKYFRKKEKEAKKNN